MKQLRGSFVQLIVILLFAIVYWGISVRGDRGDLENPDLLQMLYRPLRDFSGKVTDLKLSLRGDRPPQSKVVIVGVDRDSLPKFGRFPWHRRHYARIIEEISQFQPKVIGVNLHFAEPDREFPAEVEADLRARGAGEILSKWDNDGILAATTRHLKDKIVLGFASQQSCQPTQSKEVLSASCSVYDEKYLELFEGNFKRFAIQDFKKEAAFDFEKSPVYISQKPILNEGVIQDSAEHMGFFDAEPDADGVQRRTVLVKFANENPIPSFALEVASRARDDEVRIEVSADHKISSLKFINSDRLIPVTPTGVLQINSWGKIGSIPHVSAIDLFNGSDLIPTQIRLDKELPAFCKPCSPVGSLRGRSFPGVQIDKRELFKDAIVLLGVTNLGSDVRPLPNEAQAASIHGNAMIVENLTSENYLSPTNSPGKAQTVLLLLTIGAFILAFAIESLPSVPAVSLVVLTFVSLFLADFFYFFPRGTNLNTGFVYVEYFIISALLLVNRYIVEEQQRKFLKRAFSRFVSPQVVQTILNDPNALALGGSRRELTVMFSDIRGFMPLSTRLDPKQLHEFLNEYHDAMTSIIIEQGTLDKYIGDAIMAFWGAPVEQKSHALNACQAALLMIEELKEQNQKTKARYGETIGIGIGINTGPAIVGNMGSREIFSYTVIGDDVNLASRVERLTRIYGVNIITTAATIQSILAAGDTPPPHRILDRVQVVGGDAPIDIIQIIDEPYPLEALEAYQAGRRAYTARSWDQAIEKFEECLALIHAQLNLADSASDRMIRRCEEYKLNPPESDWDGVFHLSRK